MDIILIIVLLLFAFAELGTFQAGYNVGFQNGQVSCLLPENETGFPTIEEIQKGMETELNIEFNKSIFSPCDGKSNCHTFLY